MAIRIDCRCIAILLVCFVACSSIATAQRSRGLDVSAWQTGITTRDWNRFRNNDDIEFVYIRSSRGGTTGFYNQNDPSNSNNQNTFSQRYDDPYFVQNITRATNAGIYAGAYHFSRPDIIASTQNAGGIANTGADEADHFIEMAGAWMRPGYLMPVHDFEAGDGFRTDNEMAQFAIDFSDRMFEVTGLRPAIYLNGNYANFVIGGASSSLRNEVVDKHPNLWIARWPSNPNPQTDQPNDSLSWLYGPWDDSPNPAQPWDYWQYTATGQLTGFSGNLDLNVANGGIEFVKDRLVPALWTSTSDGQWTTLSNWNSGQIPIAPVQGPGQVPRVGSLTLPDVRLPSVDDTVILDRSDTNVAVTLSSGDHEIRKLVVREALHITGGSLTVNYQPTAESTSYSAQFSAPVFLTGGSLSTHTIEIDPGQSFLLGGSLTFNTLELSRASRSPASIGVVNDVQLQSLSDETAVIRNGPGTTASGEFNLNGGTRVLDIADGAAAIDVSIEVPIANGSLTKTGEGTLELAGSFLHDGNTSVEDGKLVIADALLADNADLSISSLGLLELDFNATDVIDRLLLDGVSQPIGTWGGIGSGADFISPLIIGTGLLQVTSTDLSLVGDFNTDGSVDANDLVQWQSDYAQNADSDADTDGDSDGSDFLAWQNNFGQTSTPLSSLVVPEPTALLLTICFATASMLRRPTLTR